MTALPSPRPLTLNPAWTAPTITAVVFLVFFMCEHNLRISLATAYTQSLDEMSVTAEGGNLLRRVMFMLLAAVGGGLTLLALPRPWRLRLPLAMLVVAVPAWCFLSLLWAQDFGMCTRRLIVLGCCCAGAFGVGRYFSLREICWMLFATTLAASFVGVTAECVLGTFRPWSGDYRYSGSMHPNSTGIYLGALLLSAATLSRLSPQHRWKYLAAAGWAFALLVLTKSRTATAAAIVAAGCLGMLQLRLRMQLLGAGVAVWSVAALFLVIALTGVESGSELKSLIFLGREEQAESFTGRGEIWPQVTKNIARRPLTGYGFESFWTPDKIAEVSDEVQWAVREAHSSYLEVTLGVGLIGAGLLGLLIVTSMGASVLEYACSGDPCFAWLVALLVFGLIDGTMESGLVTPQMVGFFLGCAFVCLATKERPEQSTAGALA